MVTYATFHFKAELNAFHTKRYLIPEETFEED